VEQVITTPPATTPPATRTFAPVGGEILQLGGVKALMPYLLVIIFLASTALLTLGRKVRR
jgi:hypothetical protein